MVYRIVYHVGKEIGIKTRVLSGTAELDGKSLVVKGDPGIVVPFKDIASIIMFRPYGTCRMLKIVHSGGTLFLTVVRLNLTAISLSSTSSRRVNFSGAYRLASAEVKRIVSGKSQPHGWDGTLRNGGNRHFLLALACSL